MTTICRIRVIYTLLAWTIGCISSALLFMFNAPIIPAYSLDFCDVSTAGLLMSLVIPLLVSHLVYKFSGFQFILPVVVLKGFTFTYSLFCICTIYGSAAWLVQYIVLFSDLLCVCLYLWFWLRQAVDSKYTVSELWLCIVCALVIGFVDIYCIMPIGAAVLY